MLSGLHGDRQQCQQIKDYELARTGSDETEGGVAGKTADPPTHAGPSSDKIEHVG